MEVAGDVFLFAHSFGGGAVSLVAGRTVDIHKHAVARADAHAPLPSRLPSLPPARLPTLNHSHTIAHTHSAAHAHTTRTRVANAVRIASARSHPVHSSSAARAAAAALFLLT